MTINANGNIGGAAAALAALQALQLTSAPSGATSGAQTSGTTSGSTGSVAQAPLLILNGASQTSPSQSGAQALAQGLSLTDAAGAVAQSLSQLLQQIQQTATAASNPGLTSAGRGDLSSHLATQLSGFSSLLASAQIHGQNLLNGSLTANPTFAIPGGGAVSVQPQDLTLGGPLVSLSSNASVSTASAAVTTASLAGLSISSVESAIGQLYDQGDQINGLAGQFGANQLDGSATVTASAGDDEDSAGLIALQLQQTLTAQPSISLSNPASQAILSLFRS